MKRGKQRPGLHEKCPPRDLLDPPGDPKTVEFPIAERLEDEEVERTLQEVDLIGFHFTYRMSIRL